MNYQMPIKIIIKTLLEEMDITFKAVLRESVTAQFSSELKEVWGKQRENVAKLDSYELIDDYLRYFRGLDLQEWIDSL